MLIATFKAIMSTIRTTAEVVDINMDSVYHVSAAANDQARIYRATAFKEAKEDFAELQQELDALDNQREKRRQDLLKKIRVNNQTQTTQQQLSAPSAT